MRISGNLALYIMFTKVKQFRKVIKNYCHTVDDSSAHRHHRTAQLYSNLTGTCQLCTELLLKCVSLCEKLYVIKLN